MRISPPFADVMELISEAEDEKILRTMVLSRVAIEAALLEATEQDQ